MKCLISKSQIRLLFCLVWWSIVFLYALISFTQVHQGNMVHLYLIFENFSSSVYFFVFSSLWYFIDSLATFGCHFPYTPSITPTPLKKRRKNEKKNPPTDLLSIKKQRFHQHQTYFNHSFQFKVSFGKLIFKIRQRQKTISTKNFVNYCNLIMLLE